MFRAANLVNSQSYNWETSTQGMKRLLEHSGEKCDIIAKVPEEIARSIFTFAECNSFDHEEIVFSLTELAVVSIAWRDQVAQMVVFRLNEGIPCNTFSYPLFCVSVQKQGQNLLKLTSSFTKVEKWFSYCVNLQTLCVDAKRVSADFFSNLSQLPKLQSLDFTWHKQIEEKIFNAIAKLSTLQEIAVRVRGKAKKVNERALGCLRKLPALTSYTLDMPSCVDENLKLFSPFTQLKTIELKSSGVTGPGLSHFSTLISLNTLILTRQEPFGAPLSLSELPALSSLDTLIINGVGHTVMDWNKLSQLNNLTKLEVFTSPLFNTVPAFAHLTNLKEAMLCFSNDLALGNIKSLTNLETLKIIGQVTGSGFVNFKLLTNLTKLTIFESRAIRDENFSCISEMTRLKNLSLTRCMLGKHLDCLSTLVNLEHLYLRDCQTYGQVPHALTQLTNLKSLALNSWLFDRSKLYKFHWVESDPDILIGCKGFPTWSSFSNY